MALSSTKTRYFRQDRGCRMSSAKQRSKIGYLRKLNGLNEDIYREMLLGFGVCSSKDLSDNQAEIFIQRLNRLAIEAGLHKPRNKSVFNKHRFNDCANREGMATPAQLRKIEAMWFGVSYKTTDAERKKALNHFIERIVSKSSIRFLTSKDVHKVIKALENTKNKEKQQ